MTATCPIKVILFSLLAGAGMMIPARGQTPLWKTLPELPAMPAPDESGLAPVNGIQLYYAVFNKGGKGPVMLLHGGLCSSDCWAFEVPLLAKEYKVIVADSRGHGRSGMGNSPLSYRLMTSDILKLMDYLKIKKTAIVGWSDGGIIGLLMAIYHPERMDKLFTFGANYNLSGYKETNTDTALAAVFMKRMENNYRRLSSTPDSFPALRRTLVKMYRVEPDIDTNHLKAVRVPVVIAGGEYDQFIKQEHFKELARLIPGARLVIIPDVSHGGPWQDPAAFHQAIVDWLRPKF